MPGKVTGPGSGAALETLLGQQIAGSEVAIAASADGDHSGHRTIDHPHGEPFPQGGACGDEAFRLGALVGEIDLLHQQQPGHPGIGAEKTREVEMQNAGPVFAEDLEQAHGGRITEAPGILDHFDGYVGRLQKAPDRLRRLFQEAEHGEPAAPGELLGEFLGVHFTGADAVGVEAKDGDYCVLVQGQHRRLPQSPWQGGRTQHGPNREVVQSTKTS